MDVNNRVGQNKRIACPGVTAENAHSNVPVKVDWGLTRQELRKDMLLLEAQNV